MQLDPLISLLLVGATALLFAGAAYHKLCQPAHFVAVITDYQLAPSALSNVLAATLIGAELSVVVLVLAGLWQIAMAVAATLLVLYCIAVGVNLLRGRRDIDCGCAGPAASQTISGWLMVRNLALLLLVCLAIAPRAQRAFEIADWATLLLGLVTMAGLYAAVNTLIANQLRLTTDRESRLWKTR